MEMVHPLPGTPESLFSKKQALDDPKHLPIIAEDLRSERSEATHQPYRRRFRPKLSAPPISPASQNPTENPDTWKAPDDWDVSPGEKGTSGSVGGSGILDGTVEFSGLTLDIAHMQRELDQMVKASPQIILQRLKDTWGCYDPEAEPRDNLEENPELDEGLKVECDEAERTVDAALAYKEREMEKKRWLLSVLNNMEAITESGVQLSQPSIEPKTQKVLALFETQGSFSLQTSISLKSADLCHRNCN